MTTPTLELVGVSKDYVGSPPVRALNNVSLQVQPGEFAAIVGPSGSGKSTLLQIIGTLDRPSSGTVLFEGTNISEMDDFGVSEIRAKKIGFVFQQFFLMEAMTAAENVAQGLLYTGMNRSERDKAAGEALDQVGLSHRAAHKPTMLSGGERQRVAIARAIARNPAIVLADEPTGNLDSHTGDRIMALLHNLNRESNTTILVITHDHDVAYSLDRQIEIQDGTIIHDSVPFESVVPVWEY